MLYSVCDAIARDRNLPCRVAPRGFDLELPQRSGSGCAGGGAHHAGGERRCAGGEQRYAGSEQRCANSE